MSESLSNLERLKKIVNNLPEVNEKFFKEHQVYEKIISTMSEGVWVVDDNRKTIFVNDKMANMLGYTAQEMINSYSYTYVHEDDKEYAAKLLDNRRKGIEEVVFFRVRCKNNEYKYLFFSSSPILDLDNKFNGAVSTAWEDNHASAHSLYKKIFFDVFDFGCCIIDINGKIREVNQALCQMFGYTDQELVNMNFKDILSDDEFKEALSELKEDSNSDSINFKNIRQRKIITKEGNIINTEVKRVFIKEFNVFCAVFKLLS